MGLIKHVVLIIFTVGAIFLAVAAGAGLLNRTPLRRPPDSPPQQEDDHQRGP